MTFLLDSNTCIRYLNGRSLAIVRKVASTSPDEIVLCSIVKGEMWYGALRSVDPVRSRFKQDTFFSQFRSLAFNDHAATYYSRVRADLAASGRPVGPNDVMIAAITLANDLILVTHNTGEFNRISDLKLEDWELEY